MLAFSLMQYLTTKQLLQILSIILIFKLKSITYFAYKPMINYSLVIFVIISKKLRLFLQVKINYQGFWPFKPGLVRKPV